jgi:hypothetical protein
MVVGDYYEYETLVTIYYCIWVAIFTSLTLTAILRTQEKIFPEYCPVFPVAFPELVPELVPELSEPVGDRRDGLLASLQCKHENAPTFSCCFSHGERK